MASVRQMIRSIHQVDPVMDRKFLEAIPGALSEFENAFTTQMVHLMDKTGKPILGVNLLPEENARTIVDVEGSPYKGVYFLTPERAVKALARMNAYRQWRTGEEQQGQKASHATLNGEPAAHSNRPIRKGALR
jgi:acyl-CoA synthetase (NDP forming)